MKYLLLILQESIICPVRELAARKVLGILPRKRHGGLIKIRGNNLIDLVRWVSVVPEYEMKYLD